MKEKVIAALKNVLDPEIPVNIWDLGLIYDIKISKMKNRHSKVSIKMTLTSPTCPEAEFIIENARSEIAKIEEVGEVNIELVWAPVWNLSKMSDLAKAELDLTGMGW